jgi:hypothetical protein
MNRPNPLDFFEKIGEEGAQEPAPEAKEKGFLDPGEEALAGLSIGASLLATTGTTLGGMALGHLTSKKDIPWQAHSPGEFSTVEEMIKGVQDLGPPKPKKLLGLIPISERPQIGGVTVGPDRKRRKFMGIIPMKEEVPPMGNYNKAGRTLERIQPEVDSFIKKHRLAEKGVKMELKRSGLLSGGAHYNVLTKKVHLPVVEKGTMIHELAHAADFTGSKRGKFWGYARGPIQNAVLTSLPIALIAGDEIKKALPGTMDDRAIEFMQQNAPELMGATLAATQLYPEAKASIMALQHIKQRSGPAAARAAAKTLIPAWGTYALATVAPLIGMSMARKYYNEAKRKNQEEDGLDKEGGFIDSYARGLYRKAISTGEDLGHVAGQISRGTKELIEDPKRGARIRAAAKEVGTSPEFIAGALYTGIPAALATGYLYSQRHGQHARPKIERASEEMLQDILGTTSGTTERMKDKIPEEWKERHPALYASLVGAGAAFSGGVISKLMSDLAHAL